MKFTVDVEDFYMEEGEISAELQRQLKQAIVSEIRESIKKQVETFMDQHVKSVINAELQTRVQMLMDEQIATGKVKGSYSSEPQMTVKEWISKAFADQRTNVVDGIKKQVDKHVKELQSRYDMLFATQLITKIKEQGFLKDEAVKMLLTSEEGN